jgi:hypothetical protein
MGSSLRESIFSTEPDLRRESLADIFKDDAVTLARWAKRVGDPAKVFVSELGQADRNSYQSSQTVQTPQREGLPTIRMDLTNTEAKLLVLAMVDEAGARIFTEKGDATKLGKFGSAMIDPLYLAAVRLSRLDPRQGKAAKDFFETTLNGESPSGSALSVVNGTSSP